MHIIGDFNAAIKKEDVFTITNSKQSIAIRNGSILNDWLNLHDICTKRHQN